MTEVTILSRSGCHLCDVALRMAHRIQADLPFSLHHIDIAADPQLMSRYGRRIPVIFIDGSECSFGKVTERKLRTAIKKARWRGPISRILSRIRSIWRGGDHFS